MKLSWNEGINEVSVRLICCRPAAKPIWIKSCSHVCGDNLTCGNKDNLRTIESQIVQKRKNNEARPKFTGSYKKYTCKRSGQGVKV